MRDWKTTIAAAIAAVFTFLPAFGITIPTEVQQGVVAVAIFLVGFFAKDAQITVTPEAGVRKE